MSSKLIVILGAGPGIGTATATQFASQGFNVALLSRNADRLKDDAANVSKSAGNSNAQIRTFPVDIADDSALQRTLAQVKEEMGLPEVVLFNAARVAPSEFGKTPISRLTEDFQVMNVGLYVTATWALPLLESVKEQQPDSHPSFFMTGGGIWQYPLPPFFALSLQKAAQVNLANVFAQIAGPKGVHVATVSVNGPVSDSDPIINAKNVANKWWELYQQKKDNWESLVQVGDLAALQQ